MGSLQPPTTEEKRLFGVFISHSSGDNEYLFELAKKMSLPENGMNPIYDESFIHGGEDFHAKIRKCINCYVGVVIVSKNALGSDWVSYECGFFKTLGMPVIIWDPNDVFSMNMVDSDLLNAHLIQYLPAYRTADEVIEALKKISVFSDIFNNEFRGFNKSDFRQMLHDKVSTVMVNITSDALDDKADLFSECMLGTLVVNFGMFYSGQGDGEHCWASRRRDASGVYTLKDAKPLENHTCKISGGTCTMFSSDKLQHGKQECVILNHVMSNGRYFKKDEIYYNSERLEKGRLSFYVPVHKLYGTEFKFIVDAPSNKKHHELLRLFENMGLNPTVSGSLNGWRIYLSLPEAPAQGLFRLDHMYSNNFLCPRSAATLEERK